MQKDRKAGDGVVRACGKGGIPYPQTRESTCDEEWRPAQSRVGNAPSSTSALHAYKHRGYSDSPWVRQARAKLLDKRGQGTTEYAILVGVLVVIAIIAIVAFRGKIKELWDAITQGVNSL